MPAPVVELHQGRAVLTRHGVGEPAIGVRREARTLTLVAGPGAPEIIALDDHGESARLVVAYPGPPLRRWRRTDVAAVAAVLERAHAADVVHGHVGDEVVAAGPVLLGWERARLPGDADGATAADDVAALGAMIAQHFPGDRALQALAARAQAADPRARPSAAALAASLREGPRRDRPRRDRRRHRVRPTILAAIVAGLVLFRPDGGAERTSGLPPSTNSMPTTTTTTIEIISGDSEDNVVTNDGTRWQVGRPGDRVLLVDHDCDGMVLPVVLRPATGEVWRFDRWPTDDRPRAAELVATVPGARRLAVIRRDTSCAGVATLDDRGRATEIS